MKGVNIFLADGFEDVEALATNDVLRRGGVDVGLVSISDDPFVMSSHGITIGVESSIHDIDLDDHKGTGAKDVMDMVPSSFSVMAYLAVLVSVFS